MLPRIRRRTRKTLWRVCEKMLTHAPAPLPLVVRHLVAFLRNKPAQPAPTPHGVWCNATLKTEEEWRSALADVERLRLRPHPTLPKNWDSCLMLRAFVTNLARGARILDAGASWDSAILPWLARYGYRNLTAINLKLGTPVFRDVVRYEYGDITRTRYRCGTFDAVICQSVIEHGVDLSDYFREMSRILKRGGVLITSTDYWENPVDAKGQVAFGVPVKVFTRRDIEGMVKLAEEFDFTTTSALDLECHERPIGWLGMEYTFVIFTLCKSS